ncbi:MULTISPECIES: alpha/beta hydrolase [Stenotrophomonas]|uniref:Alpha/beta hydrolase fold-3 domain-containing protein n=1 Tax=Stenotrophomonas maltophilia TaxID=40324 RepID=A0A2J0UCC1_STEMA|nr:MULTISPECIES: alpha/beta hydrolase [Stenotrophomonas]PJL29079.1 hypothetical protein B9Y64_12150 [Stenotrophomonas maltophilia]HDS1146225.1 alpha/beta hydrolase [Stenotrophomonas maltophilia]HDS1161141.1 alpha/beta hydrolase [Stenotrophomonas maltophilia]
MRLRNTLPLAVLLLSIAAITHAGEHVETYRQVDGRALKVHVYSPAKTAGNAALLLFHGGGWAHGEPAWMEGTAAQLQAMGIVAIAVEYRLSGASSTPADAQRDTCAAFMWAAAEARRLHIDPARVGGYGVSAGGQLVAAAALGACGENSARPRRVVLWSPALDVASDGWFKRLMKGQDSRWLDPVANAGAAGPPMLIVQGEQDTVTPLRVAERFCAARDVAHAECRLLRYPQLGHLLSRNLTSQESVFDVDARSAADAWQRIESWLQAAGWLPANAGEAPAAPR